MEKWFNKIILETENVLLRPLTIEDKNDLVEASKDGDLSELWFTTVPTEETVEKYINAALEEHNADKGLPFVVIDKKANKIIGTTRYMNGVPEYRKLEIGHTWYAKSYQKTYVNTECKFLLLTHAFEVLKAIAVEFRRMVWFGIRLFSPLSKTNGQPAKWHLLTKSINFGKEIILEIKLRREFNFYSIFPLAINSL